MTDRSQPAVPARRIAYFISPHGFGHAARAASVMEALAAIEPTIRFDIFTSVPDWFFSQNHAFAFEYHQALTDIGLIQETPFQADLPATIQALKGFLPFDQDRIDALGGKLRQRKCELVICDIAPMGICIAQKAGLPSVLIENFTWDWIYRGYEDDGLNEYIPYLKDIFADATYHVQTRPVCKPLSTDLLTAPASRKSQKPADEIRHALGLPQICNVVMITAGGVPKNYGFLDKLKKETDTYFIIPGAADSESIRDNLILLPESSSYFHPDLINTADAVVGKVGYSTIAEIYQAGVPFGYVARDTWRESQPLVGFVKNHMCGLAIAESEFQDGTFTEHLATLLQMPRLGDKRANGADQIADFIFNVLNK